MRQAAIIRPKNYKSFQTVCDSDSYQGAAAKDRRNDDESGTSWTNDWMKMAGNKKRLPVQEVEAGRLREENELLKGRLNAANNAIRDLENVCKKHQDQGEEPTPSSFCSFLPKKYRGMQSASDGDDRSSHSAAVASQASTVRMGSLTKKKCETRKQKNNNRRNNVQNDESPKSSRFKPSCSKSLLFGSKLRKQLAQRESSREQRDGDVTPPCTPERPTRNTDNATDHMPVADILKDMASHLVGIVNFRPTTVPKNERRNKLLSLSRLSTKTHASGVRGETDYEEPDGAYPIDIQSANPIYDSEVDDSEEDASYLSVIHEEYYSDEEDRAEI